jgi:P2 family phage contractile tail tube protein
VSNIVPEKGINFAVYYEGEDMLGMAEGEFPNLEYMTEEVKGAGLAGPVESIVLGHFAAMTLSLTWRNTTDAFVRLSTPRTHELYLHYAQQDYDAGLGEYKVNKIAVFVRVTPKVNGLGKLAVGEMTDTKSEFGVSYLKLEINDKERVEIDKYNYICKIDGVDYLAGVRSALGKQ